MNRRTTTVIPNSVITSAQNSGTWQSAVVRPYKALTYGITNYAKLTLSFGLIFLVGGLLGFGWAVSKYTPRPKQFVVSVDPEIISHPNGKTSLMLAATDKYGRSNDEYDLTKTFSDSSLTIDYIGKPQNTHMKISANKPLALGPEAEPQEYGLLYLEREGKFYSIHNSPEIFTNTEGGLRVGLLKLPVLLRKKAQRGLNTVTYTVGPVLTENFLIQSTGLTPDEYQSNIKGVLDQVEGVVTNGWDGSYDGFPHKALRQLLYDRQKNVYYEVKNVSIHTEPISQMVVENGDPRLVISRDVESSHSTPQKSNTKPKKK